MIATIDCLHLTPELLLSNVLDRQKAVQRADGEQVGVAHKFHLRRVGDKNVLACTVDGELVAGCEVDGFPVSEFKVEEPFFQAAPKAKFKPVDPEPKAKFAEVKNDGQ